MRLSDWFKNPRKEDPGLKEKILSVMVDERVAEKVAEMKASMPISMLTDTKDLGWRRLTGDNTRDLDPMSRYQMIRVAEYLGIANPLAKWMLDISADFICGKGFTFSATSEETQAWLEDFWYDPAHNLDAHIRRYARNLSLYGDLCFPTFVNKFTGRVKLAFIDPLIIEDIIADPASPIIPILVKILGREEAKPVTLATILAGDEAEAMSQAAIDKRQAFASGQCFYFAVNQPGAACRGVSDLFALGDWLDGYDQALWALMERTEFMNNHIWDVTLEGMSADDIDKWLLNQGTPKPGAVRAHNEKVKWSAVTPDFKGTDNSDMSRIFRNHILGGLGLPEHWFGGGGNVNKATASEMDTPTMTMFASRQEYIVNMLYQLCDYAIEQGIEHGMLKDNDETRDYKIDTPELAMKDVTKIGAALQQITNSLAVALTNKLIDPENASKVFCQFVSQAGTEIDADQAWDAAQKMNFTEAFEDYQDKPPAGVTVKAAKTAHRPPSGLNRRRSGRYGLYKGL